MKTFVALFLTSIAVSGASWTNTQYNINVLSNMAVKGRLYLSDTTNAITDSGTNIQWNGGSIDTNTAWATNILQSTSASMAVGRLGITPLNTNGLIAGLTVVQFGADPSGVTNSQTAFQNGLDAAAAAQTPLIVPPGLYSVANTLTWPDADNVRIEGYGPGISRVQWGGGYAFNMATTSSRSNAQIVGLTITSSNLASRAQYGILVGTNIHQITVDNCEFSQFDIAGFGYTALATNYGGQYGSTIRNSYFHHMGPAAAAYMVFNGDNISIINNRVEDYANTNDAHMHGIYDVGGNNQIIAGNIFVGTNADITLHGYTGWFTNTTIIGNSSYRTKNTYLYSLKSSSVVGNTMYDSKLTCIDFHSSVISGNTVVFQDKTDSELLYGSGLHYCLVTGNNLRAGTSSTTNVLFWAPNLDATKVSENIFYGGFGQMQLDTGTRNLIENNVFQDASAITGPIKLTVASSGNQINRNFFYHHETTGTNVLDSSTAPGNRYYNNDWTYGGALSIPTGFYGTPRYSLAEMHTSIGNTGTTEVVLWTNVVNGSTLKLAGDQITGEAWGAFKAGATNKQVRVYFGGIIIGDTGPLAFDGGFWNARFRVARNDTGGQAAACTISTSSPLLSCTTTNCAPAQNLANPVNVKVAAIGGNDNDVTLKGFTVDYAPYH